MSLFSYTDSDGKEFTAKDTAENRVSVKNQGYTITEGLGKTITEVARGADEVMGDHVISKYSPTMIVPRLVTKGVAGLGDARTNEEIRADKLIYEDSDGKQFTTTNNPENVKALTEQGYKIHDLTTEGARGMASAFGEQSQNQYLFGIPHMLDNPEEKKRHEDLAKENPVSNIAGGVAGTAASLLTPGLNGAKAASLAERASVLGLEKLGVEGVSLGGKAAQIIAGEAARGVTYATPHALAEAVINEDPKKAGQELLLGLGIGGLFGVGRFGVGQAVEKIAAKVTPELLNEKANQLLLDQAGLTAAQKVKLPDEEKAVQLLVENGVFGSSKKETAQNIKKLVEESGPGVGKVVSSLDKGLEKAIEMPKPEGMSVFGFDYRKLSSEISALSHDMVGPLREGEKKIVEDSANQILAVGDKFATKEGSLTFEKAQELKKIMQGEANYRTDASDNVNMTRKAIASMTRQEMEMAADRTATAVADPKLIEQWGKYRGIFAAGKTLEKAADKVLNAKGETSSILDLGLHHIGPFKAAGVYAGHLAGPIGAYVGGAIGGKADKLLFSYLKENVGTKMALWLKKQANNPDLPSYIALAASANAKEKIAGISGAIENMAVRGAVAATTHDPIKKILGEEANGRSKDQQFDMFSKHVTDSQGNPEATKAHINQLLSPIAEKHLAMGDSLMEDSLKKMEYIYNILPKNPDANKPFVRNEKWKPTKIQLNDFNKQLAVADDPFHVISELKAGTLTSKQVATLSYLNPEILQAMRDEVAKIAYSGKAPDLTYQQKLQVSLLMGQSMVKSLDYIQPAQAAYQGFGPVDPGAAGPPPTGRAPKMNPKSAEKHATLSQRLNGK